MKAALLVCMFLCSSLIFPQGSHRHSRNNYAAQSYFYIDEIEREDGEITIEFNMPADPGTLTPAAFLINGEPLPNSVYMRFSRKANKVEIKELPEWRHTVISVQAVGVYTVSGIKIENIPPIYLAEGDEYERDEDLDYVYWYWYDTHGGQSYPGSETE